MKELQKRIKKFCRGHGLEHPPEALVLDLASEVGELAKEVLKASKYGDRPAKVNDKIKSELGDALYSLITVANRFDIDLTEVLEAALKKYEKRLDRGGAGSEND